MKSIKCVDFLTSFRPKARETSSMSSLDVAKAQVMEKTKAPGPIHDASINAHEEGESVTLQRRRCHWRVVPFLAAACVAAVVAAQMWRMSASDGVGLEATAMRSGRFSAGTHALKDPNRSSYVFAHEFATKTAYWDQRAERSAKRALLSAPGARQPRVFRPDLQLVQTQTVIRHGIRCVCCT
jgi:hypothetical protein